MAEILKRAGIPILIVVVIAVTGVAIHRLHGVFGRTELTREGAGLSNDPALFNLKSVRYEIFGPRGTVATISYLDLHVQPQEVNNVFVPWSLTLTTTAPAVSADIVAQGNSGSIGCRISVDGEVEAEKMSNGVHAQTFCLVKSA